MYAIFLHTRRYCKQSILFKIFKIIIDQSNFTFSPYLFRTKNRRIQEHTSPDRPQSRASPTRLPAWRYWGGFSPPKLGILEKKIPKMGMRFSIFPSALQKGGWIFREQNNDGRKDKTTSNTKKHQKTWRPCQTRWKKPSTNAKQHETTPIKNITKHPTHVLRKKKNIKPRSKRTTIK